MMAGFKSALAAEAKAVLVKLGLGLMLILALAAGGFWIKALKADLGRQAVVEEQLKAAAAEAGRQLQAARAETAGLARELERSYQAIADREAEKNRLSAEKEARQAEMCEVYNNDQSAKNWFIEPVPGRVLDRLCRPLPVPADPSAPGGLSPGCAGAPIKNGDLVNWILDLQQALRQSNSDKAALRDWVAEIFSPAEP